jgi:O-antigen/teichoic acid export membrane protein
MRIGKYFVSINYLKKPFQLTKILIQRSGKLGFSFVDQAFFTGTNFLISILLARWLIPEQFGGFASAFSIFILVGALHTAFFSEPLLIFGANYSDNLFRYYLGGLLFWHFCFTILASLLLIPIAVFLNNNGSKFMAENLFGLSLAMPFILFQWLMRRVFYAKIQPKFAAIGSGAYCLVMFFGVFVCLLLGHLSPFSAWITMGISGAIVGGWLSFCAKPMIDMKNFKYYLSESLLKHWNFGSWNLLGTATYWLSGQIILILVPIFLGLSATAQLGAALNIYRPLNPLIQSVTILLLPTISKLANDKTQQKYIKDYVTKFLIASGCLFLVYGLIATASANVISDILYEGKYENLAPLIFLFCLSYTASSIISILTAVMKAFGKVKQTIYVWGFSAVITLLFTIPLINIFGLNGAILTLVVSYITAAISAILQLRKVWTFNKNNNYA